MPTVAADQPFFFEVIAVDKFGNHHTQGGLNVEVLAVFERKYHKKMKKLKEADDGFWDHTLDEVLDYLNGKTEVDIFH